MKHSIKVLIRLFKINKTKELNSPINRLYDCVDQLAAIYAYRNGDDFKVSQRDILNLRMAEISFDIETQLKRLL